MGARTTEAMDRVDRRVDDIIATIDRAEPVDWSAVNSALDWESARTAYAAVRDSLDQQKEADDAYIAASG